MAGIVRIDIVSDWNDWRTQMSRDLAPAAGVILRRIYDSLGMPLAQGETIISCTKEEAKSRYDWQEGIDTILYFENNTKATLQEKYLTFRENTATFEEMKGNGAPGAWYYCTAQYYWVGYARRYKDEGLREFQTYVLIDLPALHREDNRYDLGWKYNENGRDGRHATFRYLPFEELPPNTVIRMATMLRPDQFMLPF